MENTNSTASSPKNSGKIFIVLTVVFAISTMIFGFLYFSANKELKETVIVKNEVTDEKTDLLNKLQNIEKKYDTLSQDYSNLDTLFNKEKQNATHLIAEIKKLKGSAADYKKKVAALENRLDEYLKQIEELKAKNEALTVENLQVKTALDSTTQVATNLHAQNKDLSNKVEAGSVLKAYEIAPEPIKLRGTKEISTKNPKKVKKIRTCFLLSENAIAKAGNKKVYIRISDPSGEVLCDAKDDAHMFSFEGKQIVFTQSQDINYQNKAMDLCVYYDVKKELKKGHYTVDIFVDQNSIGTSFFTLE